MNHSSTNLIFREDGVPNATPGNCELQAGLAHEAESAQRAVTDCGINAPLSQSSPRVAEDLTFAARLKKAGEKLNPKVNRKSLVTSSPTKLNL